MSALKANQGKEWEESVALAYIYNKLKEATIITHLFLCLKVYPYFSQGLHPLQAALP
jgi:hypothetical protein